MRFWRWVLIAGLCLAATAAAQPVEPVRTGQADFIKRVVFAEQRLWLLADDGDLTSIDPAAPARRPETTPGGVLDLCDWGGRTTILFAGQSDAWGLYRRQPDGGWARLAVIPREGDQAVGLTCEAGNGAALLSTRRLLRLVEREPGKVDVTTHPLSGPLRSGLVTSLHADADVLWAGIDAGEWGGGLMRIDMATGQVATVARNDSGALCGGPLNTDCDPVNGVETEPWKPQCLVVSIGLEHMLAQGRLVEVCPDAIRTLAELPLGSAQRRDNRGPLNTVPFFGIVRTGDALEVAGANGLYQVTAKGVTRLRHKPAFKDVGGVQVAFDDPHLVLVLTQINRRAAVSGATPLLAVR